MSGKQIVMADLLGGIGFIPFALRLEQLIGRDIDNRLHRDLKSFTTTRLFLVAIGILFRRFKNPLDAGASPVDMPRCAAPLLWSVAGNQSFTDL